MSGGGAILGLNQYTHSAACCLLAPDGEPLFALAKERISRKKFDGGDVAELVEYALQATGLALGDVGLVVANNHLFRIRPFEETLAWAAALDQYRPSYLDPHNLLPGVPKHELSHHLAHAWSVLPLAPFDEGLIVVMDGIGSTLRDVETAEPGYTTDLSLPPADGCRQVPARPDPRWGWREAESVYRFRGLRLERLFKRWTAERTPTFLYNYGFENMESLGAVYSRVSSHVFGDWNACGKVMGLAPWDACWNAGRKRRGWLLRGGLDELQINWPRLRRAPHPNRWDQEKHRPGYARLAAAVQDGLEEVVLRFLHELRQQTGATNLCCTGGVALNSTLNGRIVRECGFEQVFIPPYPGDEGIAVGCALYGHHQIGGHGRPRRRPFTPFLGRAFRPAEIRGDLRAWQPWLRARRAQRAVAEAAAALAKGRVIGWFQGRSELGPRALGNRSILADPRPAAMIDRINIAIKKRERFRPFAPTVLADRAAEFFDGAAPSPYMSLTVPARPGRRRRLAAVVHVDGSSRLQTLSRRDNPRFYALIQAFERLTGLPLLLNTSFNVKGEPIVETPEDALRCFWGAELDLLVLEDWIVERRPFPPRRSWGGVRPLRAESYSAELVRGPEGEVLETRIMAFGEVHEASELELAVLDACRGEQSLAELARKLELDQREAAELLGGLYRKRLIRFLEA